MNALSVRLNSDWALDLPLEADQDQNAGETLFSPLFPASSLNSELRHCYGPVCPGLVLRGPMRQHHDNVLGCPGQQ